MIIRGRTRDNSNKQILKKTVASPPANSWPRILHAIEITLTLTYILRANELKLYNNGT